MVSKLPHWAWSGAWLLTFIAGFVNIVGLLGFEQQALSHLTGTTSILAAALAERNLEDVLSISAIIGSFLTGSILSGLIIQDSTLQFRRRYGVALLVQCVLLCASVPLFVGHIDFGMNLVACACGLQNAMATTYSGAAVRTTHLTGILTDFGTIIGQGLCGLPVDKQRLGLYVTIISAFIAGGVAGALGYRAYSYPVLYVPAALTAVTAAYSLYKAASRSRDTDLRPAGPAAAAAPGPMASPAE